MKFDLPHQQLNLLTGEWVLVSPHRARRPWLGQVEEAPLENFPSHDPNCYLCPGNKHAAGKRNPNYKSAHVFDNDFPALLIQHLHAHFYPPLLRSANVRKFMVGYEMLGMPQRDLTPESAAERLSFFREVHFKK